MSSDRWHKNVRLMLSRTAVVFWLVLAIWTYIVRVVVTVLRDDVRASDALLDPYGLGLAAGLYFLAGLLFSLVATSAADFCLSSHVVAVNAPFTALPGSFEVGNHWRCHGPGSG